LGYYEDLNVEKDATLEEIKKSYKQLAIKHHPDRNPSNVEESKRIFKTIVEAYEVLIDTNKRFEYDHKGYVGRRPVNYKPEPPKPKPKPKSKPKSPNAPLEPELTYFGGDNHVGRSIMVHLKLTASELQNGCDKRFLIKKRDFCSYCGGSAQGWYPCPKCHNNSLARGVCGYCHTKGEVYSNCPKCKGTSFGGQVVEEVFYKIPPKSAIGHQFTIRGAGETASNKPPGNIVIVLI
jgi:molecular chaperone DnaJ